MIKMTIRNMLIALLVSSLITSAISTLYAFASLIINVSLAQENTDISTVLSSSSGMFLLSFLFIEPLILLLTFALLQKRGVNRASRELADISN
jgi:hypothetical protein